MGRRSAEPPGRRGPALGVVHDGRLVHVRVHGFADLEVREPVGEDTVFRVASISKTFTAIAVTQLWERKLVDLDSPAADSLSAYRLAPDRLGFRPRP